jgi:hypothetical protein
LPAARHLLYCKQFAIQEVSNKSPIAATFLRRNGNFVAGGVVVHGSRRNVDPHSFVAAWRINS